MRCVLLGDNLAECLKKTVAVSVLRPSRANVNSRYHHTVRAGRRTLIVCQKPTQKYPGITLRVCVLYTSVALCTAQ